MFQATQSRWTTSGYDDRCLENEGARSPYSMSLFSGANENVDVKRSTQCLAHRAQGTRNAVNDNNGGNRLPDTADTTAAPCPPSPCEGHPDSARGHRLVHCSCSAFADATPALLPHQIQFTQGPKGPNLFLFLKQENKCKCQSTDFFKTRQGPRQGRGLGF